MAFDIGEIDEFEIHKFAVPGSALYFEAGIAGYGGIIWVLFLGTEPKYRRQGRARALLETLHAYADKHRARIDWGCYTEDGKKYLRHINNEYDLQCELRASQRRNGQSVSATCGACR